MNRPFDPCLDVSPGAETGSETTAAPSSQTKGGWRPRQHRWVIMRRWCVLLSVFAMLAAACSSNAAETTTSTELPPGTTTTVAPPVTTSSPPTTPTTGPPATTAPPTATPTAGRAPRANPPFAELAAVPLRTDSPTYVGPATPTSIDGIYLPGTVERKLDARATEALERNGFVVVPGDERLFHPLYQSFEYEGEVYFVTTDVGYHYLHLAFSKLLRDLEQYELLPILDELLIGLVGAARAQRDELAGTDLEWAADRVVQLYEAAATLAELDVGPIGALAQEEVELGRAAAELRVSPITGLEPADPLVSMRGLTDFSLFKPRGHYTRNEDLERYFRAMSVLGNENFVVSENGTMMLAALATRVLLSDRELLEAWRLIYEPTAFLVGIADDYTPLELAEELGRLVPGWGEDPTLLSLDSVAEAGERLLDLRPVGIDPEAASVRIMGVRFVVDSYIYDQLRYPSVGDPDFGRRYATPLDLVAAFGSDLAYEIMDESGELDDPATGERWTNYDDQLTAMSDLLAGRNVDDWASTVYDAWLYALEPVWQPQGAAFPDFMRTEAWERKNLQTGLGSYTELKHDTILYAKQSFAAQGGFEPPDYPPPRHWVEPNPVAFERMAAVIRLLESGLSDRGLLPSDSSNAELIDALLSFLDRLARLAEDELAGRPITQEDNDWLEFIGSTMEALWIRSSDVPDGVGEFPDQDTNAALVADIMRTTFSILEIGTGYVDTIFVLVPADDGRFQVAQGAVYSYYEFWRDAEDGRLTDEEWWELLEVNPPARPAWQAPFLPGGPLYEVGVEEGRECWEFGEFPYRDIVAYWVAYGMPGRMDWNDDGIPCNEDENIFEPAFFAGLPGESGLFCRDLEPDGYSFAEALAYWLREGAPDRMDADQNGIPCETIYPREEIEAFFYIGAGG